MDYQVTVCPGGWVAWSGWCYRLEKDQPLGFADALTRCSGPDAGGGGGTGAGGGGTLASLHSLDAKELISTHFHAGTPPGWVVGREQGAHLLRPASGLRDVGGRGLASVGVA